jgi:hypothetical protein
MKILQKFLLLSIFFVSVDAKSVVYKPYLVDNPDRIEFATGYCENKNQEKKLWSALYKTTKSVVKEIPSIPPDQKIYIETEINSKNLDRQDAILQTSIYKIYKILNAFENIQKLSEIYIENHQKLPLAKKTEITGRVLLNISDLEKLKTFEKMAFQKSLESRNYMISINAVEQLDSALNSFYFLKENLLFHLICYGENSK